MIGIFVSVFSMLLYLAETGMQIHLVTTYSNANDSTLFALYISYILASLVIVNGISALLVFRTMDFTDKHIARVVCVVLHICQLGLFWRCCKLFLLYDKSDWKEFLVLRLVHTAMQSIPFLLTCGYVVIQSESFLNGSTASLFITFVSSAIGVSSYNIGKFVFEADEYQESGRKLRRPLGLFFFMFGTFLMLLSRCGSTILMASSLQYWVVIPIAIHFFGYFMAKTISTCSKKKSCSFAIVFKNMLLSYLNTFELVDPGISRIHCRSVFFYTAVLLENIAMVTPWLILGGGGYLFKLCVMLVVILGFIFGIVFKTSSCGCIHESVEDTGSLDTVDIAEYILKKEKERERMADLQNNATLHKKHKRRKKSDKNKQSSQDVVDNNTQGYDNGGYLASNLKLQETEVSSKPKDEEQKTSENTQIPNYKLGSNVDVASSNSRNTNTLNISSQSNQAKDLAMETNTEKQSIGGFLRMSRSLKMKNNPKDQNSIKSGNTGKITPGVSPSPSKKSKKSGVIPLFPNELPSDVIGSKEFGTPKARHVLSNSVDEYNPEDSSTDSTYSEYASYSYYYDTDWSSMFSDDSHLAPQWPPCAKVYFSNLHALPKAKISVTESVQMWLMKLEEWRLIQEWSDHPEDPPVVEQKSRDPSRPVLQVTDRPLHLRMTTELNSSTSCTDNSQFESWTQGKIGQPRYIPQDIPPRERYYSSSSTNENVADSVRVSQVTRSPLPRHHETSVPELRTPRSTTTGNSASESGSARISSVRGATVGPLPPMVDNDRMYEANSARAAVKLFPEPSDNAPDFVQESMV